MNLFLKREVRTPDVPVAHSPYLAARREWDERYGDLLTRARNWRTMAALCSLVALVATGGMVWLPRARTSFRSSFSWTILVGP